MRSLLWYLVIIPDLEVWSGTIQHLLISCFHVESCDCLADCRVHGDDALKKLHWELDWRWRGDIERWVRPEEKRRIPPNAPQKSRVWSVPTFSNRQPRATAESFGTLHKASEGANLFHPTTTKAPLCAAITSSELARATSQAGSKLAPPEDANKKPAKPCRVEPCFLPRHESQQRRRQHHRLATSHRNQSAISPRHL